MTQAIGTVVALYYVTNGTLNALGWAFVAIGAGLTAGSHAIGWRKAKA